jgi:hypothetical protein
MATEARVDPSSTNQVVFDLQRLLNRPYHNNQNLLSATALTRRPQDVISLLHNRLLEVHSSYYSTSDMNKQVQ